VPALIAVLGSALWHLILLLPALNKESEFVRWHGRQALLLAGVRTVVPLVLGGVFGFELDWWGGYYEFRALSSVPILVLVWFFGTLWGQRQATRGDCSLMRWLGRAEAVLPREPAEEPTQVAE
jgi:hypothetical protein